MEDPEKKNQKETFRQLYTDGIEWFNENFGRPSDIPNDFMPKLTPQEFEGWYKKLFKDLYPEGAIAEKDLGTRGKRDWIEKGQLDTRRLNKIIQYGNFGVSQPTGGFVLDEYISKDFIKDQYKNAIKDDMPVLMVITEPFTPEFFNPADGVNYKIMDGTEKCGLLYNTAFNDAYSIVPFSRDEKLPTVLTMKGTSGFRIRSNDEKSEPIFIVNFHGDSKGDVTEFKGFIDNSISDNVNFITGDSNVTMAKTKKKEKTTTQEVLKNIFLDASIACSTQIVAKERFKLDILLNNQVNKSGGTSEIDGMFAVDLNKWGDPRVNSEVLWKPSPNSVTSVTAFQTPYSENNPMLGDHSVVGLTCQASIKSFKLLSATGSLMDHPTKGVFGDTDKWGGVNINTFHEKVGEKYTIGWLHIYNTWKESESFKTYVEEKNGNMYVLEDLDTQMKEEIISPDNIDKIIQSLPFFNKPANGQNNKVPNSAANGISKNNKVPNSAANGQKNNVPVKPGKSFSSITNNLRSKKAEEKEKEMKKTKSIFERTKSMFRRGGRKTRKKRRRKTKRR